MNNPKVSIIIPVYNAEKYIKACLGSILKQELKEIEIIVINDGSLDNSYKILKEYSEKDTRIKLINQENKGASAARNVGIQVAKGEYIGFIDIDDYIESDMYLKLYEKAIIGDFEVVSCSFVEEDSRSSKKITFDNLLFGYTEMRGSIIKDKYLEYVVQDKFLGHLPLWNKIFKYTFIKENNIKIDESMILGEDRKFNCDAIMKAKRIAHVNEVLYHYMKINNESVTLNYSLKKVYHYLSDRRDMLQFVKTSIVDKGIINKYEKLYYNRIFYKLIDFCFKQVNTMDRLSIKYKNIKEILNIDEMKIALDSDLLVSPLLSILIKLIKLRCYLLTYLVLTIKGKMIK